MSLPRYSAAARAHLVRIALLAMLALQCLGLGHAVAHGHGLAQQVAAGHAPASGDWGHDAGGSVCRLLDQLAQPAALPGSAPALVLAEVQQAAPATTAWQGETARPARAYLARAPPSRV